MKIIVFNSRIQSIEFDIWEMPSETLILSGSVEKIGSEQSVFYIRKSDGKTQRSIRESDTHSSAVKQIVKMLSENGIDKKEISAAGHRVVHGGVFFESVVIDDSIKKEIYKDFDIAPLHNPYNLKTIEAAQVEFADIKHVAIFDTAFHTTMPETSYRYPIPERLYQEYKIRRYGFHGLSHKYLVERTAQLLGKDINTLNMLTCHLGDGSSITAIKNGKSFDTSMGFTPLEGLMMTTRSGDISPGVVIYLLKLGWTLKEIERTFLYESGLLGVSQESGDMRVIIEKAKSGNHRCQLAIDMFVYRARKYIGAYWLNIPQIEAISLTGGIAENSPLIRKKILENLEPFGIKISESKNDDCIGKEGEISDPESKVKIFVMPRSEKLLLARETYKVLGNSS